MSESSIGSAKRPLRVAIIGSGPAAFYAAETLLRQQEYVVAVDMFERLPTPYGLVRGGVAPDHQSIKAVSRVFDRTARREGFRFFGNVTFGEQVCLEELAAHYDQVVYAVGSATDRRLEVPGADLQRCVHSTAFVGWYNGHPACRDLQVDLDVERVVVVGNGNVAIDIARVLSRTAAELERTDIAEHALEALRRSRVREVLLLGRRGPVQAAFTPAELKELGRLEDADPVVQAEDLDLDELSSAELAGAHKRVKRNIELLRGYVARGSGSHSRKIGFRFLVSPVAIEGGDDGAVRAVRLEHNVLARDDSGRLAARGTGRIERVVAQMVIPAIGYRAVALRDVPLDQARGIIPNDGGRVRRETPAGQGPAEYVVGWARTGPRGLIGSHKAGSEQVVGLMLDDLRDGRLRAIALPDPEAIAQTLWGRGVRAVSFADWRRLDEEELARGARRGAPRSKVVEVEEMLEVMGKNKS